MFGFAPLALDGSEKMPVFHATAVKKMKKCVSDKL